MAREARSANLAAPTSEQHVGSLIRLFREQQKLSIRTLAALSGFSAGFISQVENGQASPSISSLGRIATWLGVSMGEFFQAADARSSVIVRPSQRPRLESGWSKAHLEHLTTDMTSQLEAVMISILPGGTSGKKLHASVREEFTFITEGAIILALGEDQQQMKEGDAVTIQAHHPRRWINRSTDRASMLVVSPRSIAKAVPPQQ